MGWTGHGQIGWNFQGERYNSAEKTASKVSKISNCLIEYVPNKIVKK